MATCSLDYMALVVTREGLTPKDPFSKILGVEIPPTIDDYSEWKMLAQSLTGQMHSHLIHLGRIEEDKGEGFPKWNSFVEESNAIRERADGLESVLEELFQELSEGELFLTAPIQKAIDVAVSAVCLMEQIDGAVLDLGAQPLSIPPPVGGKGSGNGQGPSLGFLATVGILAITGIVIGGIVWYSRSQIAIAGEV